jgi:hypothetical protein
MVEFRLYYDDNGNVLFYTCDKPEGNYLVIDKDIYAECRFDFRIIDGKIIRPQHYLIIEKMVKSDEGTKTSSDDINIVVDDKYTGSTNYWKLKQDVRYY